MKAIVRQSDVLSAYGMGIGPLWDGLMAGRTAIRGLGRFHDRPFTCRVAAQIPDLDVPPEETRARAILRKLLVPLVGQVDPQTALILATTVGEIEHIERLGGYALPERCPG